MFRTHGGANSDSRRWLLEGALDLELEDRGGSHSVILFGGYSQLNPRSCCFPSLTPQQCAWPGKSHHLSLKHDSCEIEMIIPTSWACGGDRVRWWWWRCLTNCCLIRPGVGHHLRTEDGAFLTLVLCILRHSLLFTPCSFTFLDLGFALIYYNFTLGLLETN